MSDNEIAGMELVDEVLAEEFGPDPDAVYEQYRDKWCDALEADVKKLFETFYNNPGYYSERKEKLVEHIVEMLEDVAKVKVTAFDTVNVVSVDNHK